MSLITKLHETHGKLDMLNDLKIVGLNLSLDQQQTLLYTHQQLIDQKFDLEKQIKKEYIL